MKRQKVQHLGITAGELLNFSSVQLRVPFLPVPFFVSANLASTVPSSFILAQLLHLDPNWLSWVLGGEGGGRLATDGGGFGLFWVDMTNHHQTI